MSTPEPDGDVAPWQPLFEQAAAAMAIIARARGHSLRVDRRYWPGLAFLGLMQFSVNFNAVYVAELYITSGVVATMFALLLILQIIWDFRIFTQLNILAGGFSNRDVFLLPYYSYQLGFYSTPPNYGLGSAIAVVMTGVPLICASTATLPNGSTYCVGQMNAAASAISLRRPSTSCGGR